MNDAEFCTDAHRQSYGEEQLLAMQRLSDSAPAMQRTQRMAAHGGMGPTMTVVGALLANAPRVIVGARLEVATSAIPTAATVLFQDREHLFQAGLPLCERSIPLTLPPAPGLANSTAIIGQSHPVRIVIPRELVSRPHWKQRWSWVPVSILEPLPELAPLAGYGTCRRIEQGLAQLAYRMSVQEVRRPASQPGKVLARVVALTRLELTAAGRVPRSRQTVADANSMLSVGIQYPQSWLTTVPVGQNTPEAGANEGLWAAFEASPLGALLSATHYPTVSPAVLVPALEKATLRSHALSFPVGLTTFAAPDSAIATRGIPVHEMPEMRELQPVGLSAYVPVAGAATPVSHSPVAPAGNSALPSMAAIEKAKGLPLTERVLAVTAPPVATTALEAKWNGVWQDHAVQHMVCKLGRPVGATGMPAGQVTALPRQRAAGGLEVRGERDLRNQPLWLDPQVNAWRPSTRMQAAGIGMGSAGRVPFDWRPRPADGPVRRRPPQMLRTVLRHRMPRHETKSVPRYRRAEPVPLAPPSFAILPWRPVIEGAVDLCPAVQLPEPAKHCRQAELRRLRVRLFRISGAYPMARPLGGKPVSFGLSLWGGKPSVRPSGLIADDGTPRKEAGNANPFRLDWRTRFSADTLRNAWRKASHLPSDLKWIAMVVPLVLGIWVLSRPTAAEPSGIMAQATREVAQPPILEEKEQQLAAVKPFSVTPVETERLPIERAINPIHSPARKVSVDSSPGAWDTFTAGIANRASVDLIEDFHNGLSSWEGRGEWARSWSYDRSGTVRPGHMAIYQPTVNLRNYVMEMKASIERRSIQWMVRASSPDNYHFARLNVTPGAPLTKLELERWTVINGRTGRVTRLPLPHGGANQTVYSIRVEVHGDSITTYLQDQVIDTFNDTRLQEGGVGLVGAPDDRARIYGIRVYHQNDFLGKLCSFLAPLPITSQGSD
jgi:hypothetical protein